MVNKGFDGGGELLLAFVRVLGLWNGRYGGLATRAAKKRGKRRV